MVTDARKDGFRIHFDPTLSVRQNKLLADSPASATQGFLFFIVLLYVKICCLCDRHIPFAMDVHDVLFRVGLRHSSRA